jgi:sulfane dehydrogenase subunit SoxC
VTPHQHLNGILTPSELHFERHHGGVPDIDPEKHKLVIHGMVERPMTYTLHDLKRFPSVTRICFIECSGNLWRTAPPETTPQDMCGLMSQSEWTGVALSTLFREVGIKDGARWFLAEGSDAAVLARSVPVSKAMDDAMIAYAQNGEAIRPEQGYPVRLITPGWEGNTNVKWIRRIEVSDRPFMTREETSKYTDPLKDGTARQFSFVLDARSIITFPAFPDVLEKGWVEIRGLAWSGRGRIRQVDISTDGGRSWTPASLDGLVLPKAQARFRSMWRWDGQETEIMSRAVDETGYVQPTRAALIAARGVGSVPSHLNPITAWKVNRDGQVVYREEEWK